MSSDEINYVIRYTEVAEAELDRLYLNVSGFYGPEFASLWYSDIKLRIQSLIDFPGPLALAVEEEASQLFQCEVRRELYYGPTKQRSSRSTYRILFTLRIPFEPQEPHIILILRIMHASQPLISLEENVG